MFFRAKKSGARTDLQIVENRWEDGGSRQRVVATFGRLDELQESGELAALLHSGAAPRGNLATFVASCALVKQLQLGRSDFVNGLRI